MSNPRITVEVEEKKVGPEALKELAQDAKAAQQVLSRPLPASAQNPWTTAANVKAAPAPAPRTSAAATASSRPAPQIINNTRVPQSPLVGQPLPRPWQNSGPSGLAVSPANINPAPVNAAQTKAAAAAAKQQATIRNRQLIDDAEQDLLDAQGKGAPAAHIQTLKDQLRERKLVARFMSAQGMSEPDALQKAQGLVAAKNAATQTTAAQKAQAATAAKVAKQEEALGKARETHMMRVARAGARLAESAAGSSPFGGLTSAIGSLGPQAMAVAAVAAVVTGIATAFADQSDAVKMIGLQDTAQRGVDARRLRRQAGFEGSASSNREAAEGYRDDENEAIQQLPIAEEKARFKWNRPGDWLGIITGKAENEKLELQKRIQRDADEAKQSDVQTRDKYAKYVAPQIEAQKKMNQGHMSEARAIQDKLEVQKEYDRVLGQLPNSPEAKGIAVDAARVKAETIGRERAGSFAGLVNARDGAGDIAAVARAAHGQRVESETASAALLKQILQQGKRSTEQFGRHNFTRPRRGEE